MGGAALPTGRLATVGLAVVLAVSATQASAAVLVDTSTTSLASVTAASLPAPTGVTAAFDCGLLTIGRHVDVGWTGVGLADDYQVLRRTGTSGAFAPVGTTTSTAFTDLTVQLGRTYQYVVRARTGGWSSADSAPPVAVTTPGLCI